MARKVKEKKKNKGFLDIVLTLLLVVFCIVFCISGYKLYEIWNNYHKGTATYEKIQKESKTGKTINFKKLRKTNPDIVGWIYSKGTVIDYPIVQTTDNSYYLNHLFDKTENSSGTIFLDYTKNSNFDNVNSVIYGHHMRNGSMFASLMGYKEQDYYNKHKTLKLYTPNGNYKVEPVYGFVVDAAVWDKKNFGDDSSINRLLSYASSKTTFSSSVKCDSNSKYLTMYTCSYEIEEGRYVLICKIEKE